MYAHHFILEENANGELRLQKETQKATCLKLVLYTDSDCDSNTADRQDRNNQIVAIHTCHIVIFITINNILHKKLCRHTF